MLMTPLRRPAGTIRTGGLTIDRAERSARLNGRSLDLSPLLFRLLETLAARPGQLVTRAELKAVLWPYAVRIDTERRLNTAMRALRDRLGDDADQPRFVATERGFGYRWIGRERRQASRFRPGLLVLLGTATVMVALPSVPAEPAADSAALLRAQAAVDAWRADPGEIPLRLAASRLAAAGKAGTAGAAYWTLAGQLALESRWDWMAAEAAYARALASDPTNADARLALAWLKTNRGDRAGALDIIRALLADSVVSGDRRADLGWLLIRNGRPDLAADACPASAGQSVNALSCAHTALAMAGDIEAARHAALLLMARLDAQPYDRDRVAKPGARDGYAAFLDWRVRHFLPVGAPAFQRAQLLADAGRRDEALELLGQSVARREPLAVKIGSTPSFSGLRANPRFQALVARVGAGSA